ncbi:MAG: hypothetical protein Kow0069_12150 [Promethearchaeota archaeon]
MVVAKSKRLDEKLRRYYVEVHGFDPVADAMPLNTELGTYVYEAEFPLSNDPLLAAAGVNIVARVEVGPGGPKNRIVFVRKNRKAMVTCVHTAVRVGGDLDAKRLMEGPWEHVKVLESGGSVTLSPEEHFVSLKSFVAGVAETGIQTMLRNSFASEDVNPFTLPFGFNASLQRQVLRALRSLAPDETQEIVSEFFKDLLERVPEEWLAARLRILDGIYHIAHLLPERLKERLPKESSGRCFKFKVLVLGHGGAGKARLISRLADRAFASNFKLTVGVDLLHREIEIDRDERVRLSLWDLGTAPRFRWIRSAFYRGASGAIVVFDASDAKSFDKTMKWAEEVAESVGWLPHLLVGLVDPNRPREVPPAAQLAEQAQDLGGLYVEVEPDGDLTPLFERLRGMVRRLADLS